MPQNRTIIASFPSSTKADTAAQALKTAGITDVHVRRASRYGVSLDSHIDSPISSARTLTGITLFSAGTSNDENSATRVLMGADPSVSGYSDLGYGLAGGSAFTLVVFAPEERIEEAVGIIKQQGGDV